MLVFSCLFILTACEPVPQNGSVPEGNVVTVNITVHLAGKPVQCGEVISLQNKQWETFAFSMFLSQFSLNDSTPVILDDNDWQSQQVGLIRSVVDCSQASANMSITGLITSQSHTNSSDMYALINDRDTATNKALRLNFTIGLPFEINHQNPLVQASPLNDPSMFWVWRNGYKFIRWDMQSNGLITNDSAKNELVSDAWSFHLGSIGCQSAAMVRAPKQECAQANLVPISMVLNSDSVLIETPTADTTSLVLNVDLHLDEILGNVEATRTNTCMFSGIDSPMCQELFKNLNSGLVFK